MEDIKLPYITKEIQDRLFEMGENDKIGKMLVTIMQKHPEEDKMHGKETLKKAADIAC